MSSHGGGASVAHRRARRRGASRPLTSPARPVAADAATMGTHGRRHGVSGSDDGTSLDGIDGPAIDIAQACSAHPFRQQATMRSAGSARCGRAPRRGACRLGHQAVVAGSEGRIEPHAHGRRPCRGPRAGRRPHAWSGPPCWPDRPEASSLGTRPLKARTAASEPEPGPGSPSRPRMAAPVIGPTPGAERTMPARVGLIDEDHGYARRAPRSPCPAPAPCAPPGDVLAEGRWSSLSSHSAGRLGGGREQLAGPLRTPHATGVPAEEAGQPGSTRDVAPHRGRRSQPRGSAAPSWPRDHRRAQRASRAP